MMKKEKLISARKRYDKFVVQKSFMLKHEAQYLFTV